MRPLDWVVMFSWLAFIVSYGLYRGRGSEHRQQVPARRQNHALVRHGPLHHGDAGQRHHLHLHHRPGYTDGMRFVQFYFGLPIAMVILCATAVPIFHRANVYTAYEYLEQRFDAKTRALVSLIFLIQRGLAAGLSLYAPAVVLSVILGWPDRADHDPDGRPRS